MRWSITQKEAGMLIREFLSKEAQFSKRLIIKAKSEQGQIRVNGISQTVRYILQEEDILTVQLPREKVAPYMKKEAAPLQIMYEDEDLLIVDKPSGLATIPSREDPDRSIANRLLYYYEIHSLPYTIHIVTRLDRDTSGLVLVAKHQYCHSILAAMQKRQEIFRTYRAIAAGVIEQTDFTINQPIGRKEGSMIERAVIQDGKQAITHGKVLNRYKTCTFLELQLETGRTHQIRVHLAHNGNPLLGDDLYQGDTPHINRQALHCHKLYFVHPFTKQELEITSTLPLDMKHLLDTQDSR